MKIKYTFVTGETQEIEVDEIIHTASEEINARIKSNDRRETRRHTPLDNEEFGFAIDHSVDIEADCILNADRAKLHKALGQLNTQQKDLVRRVFFNGEQLKDIAKECSTTYQAIQNRLKKILAKLQKDF